MNETSDWRFNYDFAVSGDVTESIWHDGLDVWVTDPDGTFRRGTPAEHDAARQWLRDNGSGNLVRP